MFRTLSLAIVVHLGASMMILPTFCASTAFARQQNPAAADKLSDADLEELLAPIALYPDPLLANVLTASCYPDELAAAAKAGGKEATIDAADWEPSVKAVAKIPDALKMLTEYPEWTTAVGEAFILQSSDVMAAVQRLRARAYANGALATTEQQVVTAQQDTIIIQPAQPEVIYVPSYQPSVVYVDHYDSGDVAAAGVIGFGLGVATAAIIANNVDCDWWHGGCHYGGWGGSYHSDIDIETGDINIGTGDRNRETNIDRGDRNRETNVNRGDRTNNIKNNGNSWKPNSSKLNSSLREGKASSLNNYKGAGSGQRNANARVPNRSQSDRPIASQRPAPRPSNVNRQGGASASNRAAATRPSSQQTKRPSSMNSRSSAPKAKPSMPPASSRPPAARGTGGNPPRNPSAYNSSNRSQSASRGTSSRSNSASRGSGGGGGRSGGASRGGGGGRGGGGRGGGRR